MSESKEDKKGDKPSGLTFLEWKKLKQAKENANKPEARRINRRPNNGRGGGPKNTNIPSLLDIDVFSPTTGGPPVPQFQCTSLFPQMPFDNFMGSELPMMGNNDDFILPNQQPLQVQNIENPYNDGRSFGNNSNSNGDRGRGFWRSESNRFQPTHHNKFPNNNKFNQNRKNNFNRNDRNSNRQGSVDNSGNNQSSSNASSSGNNNVNENNREDTIGPQLPKQEKKKKKNNNWVPKPKEPPPLDFDGPIFISKEERKAQWRAYREAMKPFKYKPFLNAKREIQRLGKRDRSTLSERELNRLINAETFVAQHKAYLTHKKDIQPTWVKSEGSEPESSDGKLGEVYVLQNKPLLSTGSENGGASFAGQYENSFISGGTMNNYNTENSSNRNAYN